MYIESVQLQNFRNYRELHLNFDKGTNIFYGDNAQGKTNILESVYICGTTKSHKGSKDKDLIRFGKEESHIRMLIKKEGLSYKIDMHLRKNKAKGVAINGLPIKKARELFGIVNLVFFSPEDLNIIKNGPGERRRFMDLTGGEEKLEVLYEPSTEAEFFEETLKKNRDRDIRMKMTSSGPHRDDLCFMVNGVDIRKFGSQGQQRTAALSLKLSEIYLVKEKIKDTPVLLLDDVLSELDSNRQTYLLDCIHDIQTLITCTGLDDFVSHQFHLNKVFKVVKGEVFEPS